MGDEWRQAGLAGRPPSPLSTGRLDRRTLLRTAGGAGVAGSLGVLARRPGAAAQDTRGAITKSRSRAEVMEEILAAYPLRRAGAPTGGSVIVGNLGDLDSFNPLIAGGTTTLEFLSLIYEGLVGVHPVDGSIVPGLAEYELAADGMTYTFRIHPDARFHDGAAVTAADAEFTLETFLDPASLTYSSSVGDVLKEYRAVDDRTFVMVSKGPVASFLYDVPTVVMPKHIWASIAPADWPSDPGSTGEDPARVVGSGPFRFVEWDPSVQATLARNDDYWDRELSQVPFLDTIIYQIMPNSQTRALALETGDIDVARVSPTDINSPDVTFVSYETTDFLFYTYHLDRDETPFFQDKAVREALFIALDRQAIVDTILTGGEVARGTFAPSSPAYRPREFAEYAFDPDRARTLLDRAGWTDAGGDGVREKDGQRLSFTMLSRGDNALDNLLDAYMQDAWTQIGVEMTPEPVPFDSQIQRIDAGDFEMVRLRTGWSTDPGQGWLFGTGTPDNFFGYSNAEYDRLEADQRSTMDPAQRVDLIVEQAKIVWDELPVGIIAFLGQNVGHTMRLRNIFPNDIGGLVWSAPFWYLEP